MYLLYNINKMTIVKYIDSLQFLYSLYSNLTRSESAYIATKIIEPLIKGMTYGEAPAIVKPSAMNRSIRAPNKLPGKNAPRPPNKLVPPNTAEAIPRNS